MNRSLHPVYDDYKQWAGSYEQPRSVNVEKFQEQIDKIVGTTIDGKPIVQLIWSWNSREWIAGEWRAKYNFMTVQVPGGTVDICPPRWILEDRNEPGQYWQAWENGRYFKNPDDGTWVDLRGEPPREGWYSYCDLIADHDPNKACCDYLWENEQRRCWGYYREPAQVDLDKLQKAVHLRAQDKEANPNEPLSDAILAELGRAAFTQQQEAKQTRTDELADRFKSSMAPHLHRIETVWENGQLIIRQKDDGGRRYERYHILGG